MSYSWGLLGKYSPEIDVELQALKDELNQKKFQSKPKSVDPAGNPQTPSKPNSLDNIENTTH